jgi:dienelactone hydrolase
MKTYADLGSYSDLVTAAKKAHRLYPLARPGKATQKLVNQTLSFDPFLLKPRKFKVEGKWEADGVAGEVLSWSVGYGPRTEAWLLRPAGVKGKLPGVLALHDHGGFKYWGKEKIAIGPDGASAVQTDWWDRCYGGKAFANELARKGFCVLVHDTFTWGSRRFPEQNIPEWDRLAGEARHKGSPMASNPPRSMPDEMSRYSWTTVFHEHTVQKYCAVLGTNMSAIIAYEDRLAARYLATRKDVLPGGVGCVGLSGGGLRSTLLRATSDDVRAAVVVGLMSTYEGLLDHNVVCHTWMLYPDPAWARHGDWPDLVSCRAPAPLMVQYDREDTLFTMAGMKAAHARISGHYKSTGKPKNYVGEFYDGPHKFDLPMQASAFAFLEKHLCGK